MIVTRRPSASVWRLLGAVVLTGAPGLAIAQDEPTPPTTVRLWGGAAPPMGRVSGLTPQGVVFDGPGSPASKLVTWDRVQLIEGPLAAEAAPLLETGRLAWRARTRLARGDAVQAEPLYEELAELYRGTTGPLSARIAGGLLLCRIKRGSFAPAVGAWLAWLQAVEEMDDRQHAAPVQSFHRWVDPETGLSPVLPPIWTEGPSTAAFAASAPSGGSDVASLLHDLYLEAARSRVGLPVRADVFDRARTASGGEPGLAFVLEVVEAQAGSPERRERARRALERRIAQETRGDAARVWVEAWGRVAIGRSLAQERGAESRRMGAIQSLHVPARFGDEQRYLAGVALADVARALEAVGSPDQAQAVLRELADRYPGHPAQPPSQPPKEPET